MKGKARIAIAAMAALTILFGTGCDKLKSRDRLNKVVQAFKNARYIDAIDSQRHDDTLIIVLPELVATRWWHQLLHNQTALVVRTRLHFTPGIMVIPVPYQLHSSQAAVDRLQREDPLAWRRIGTGLSQTETDRVEKGK